MRVKVQRCRGLNGEKLTRKEWSAPIEGELTIENGEISFVARLEKLQPLDRREALLVPMFDVRVQTYEDGLMVVGCMVNADSQPHREVRMAWFCVPIG